MCEGVGDDVCEVVVDQRVHDLAAVAFTAHDARVLQYAQVLADQGLAHAERADQLVHAAGVFLQCQHDGDPHGRCECSEQVAGGLARSNIAGADAARAEVF